MYDDELNTAFKKEDCLVELRDLLDHYNFTVQKVDNDSVNSNHMMAVTRAYYHPAHPIFLA